MDRLAYVAAVAVLLVPILYMYVASTVPTHFPVLQNKRICLLIAHPDDEAMFFAPTVLALTRRETGNHVKILCLSTGDADGLGETRKKELVKSGMLLGLKNEEDVFIIDNPDDFPDSMTKTWEESKISSLLCSAFATHLASKRPGDAADQDDTPPQASIDVLITFDRQGISSHPNHISLYHGARAFIAALVRGKPQFRSPVDLYTLTSVAMPRKYASIGDCLTTILSWTLSSRGENADPGHPAGLVFMSRLIGGAGGDPTWGTAWKAMTEAHLSQMRWFRYGWISLSRYMLINDLRLEEVSEK